MLQNNVRLIEICPVSPFIFGVIGVNFFLCKHGGVHCISCVWGEETP